MQGTGKTYAVSGETTEWEDILIKKGITTKEDVLLSKGLNPADFSPKAEIDFHEVTKSEIVESIVANATLEELDELEEDDEFSDSKMLEEYRQKRLNEMKEEIFRARFGDVNEITKDEWVKQVTEASRSCWVVVHLYQDSVIECRLLEESLQILARKFKYIKFLKIKSTQAVENWPERNLPTLFMYNEGELKIQMITINQIGGKSMKPDDLEWWLVTKGVVTTSDLTENPRSSDDTTGGSKLSRMAQFHTRDDEFDDDEN